MAPTFGLEHAGELAFGEVDLPGERRQRQIGVEVIMQPQRKVADGLGVGRLAVEQGGELGLAAGTLKVAIGWRPHGGGGPVPVVVGDRCEREVDAGGDAC